MQTFPFSQVNVFSLSRLGGNPLAVVHSAESLSNEQMAAFATWTNLSETTYLLPPTTEKADYRVRIFTPGSELPFAGHPTLGSCFAWLSAGGRPREVGRAVQECGAGLVEICYDKQRLEFAAPPLLRSGNLEPALVDKIIAALSLQRSDIIASGWIDNGPGWCGIMLDSAEKVLSVKPDWAALAPVTLGLIGPYKNHPWADFEVRAFTGNGYEDPVTGSLNASFGQWLFASGQIAKPYIVSQGTVLGREGRVDVRRDGEEIWIGGDVTEVIRGEVKF